MFLDGMMTAFEILDRLDEHLSAALAAAGVKLSTEQRDQIIVQIWQILALRLDLITIKHELPGSAFDDVPPAIADAARRTGVELSAVAPLSEPKSPAQTAKSPEG